MSNYTVTTNFGAKDALATGNPAKTIKGSEFTTEFTNIATAISSKADSVNAAFTGTFSLNAAALTATATELNTLDGITASTAELNYCTGVTSAIQTQLNAKAALAGATFTGTVKVTNGDFWNYGYGGNNNRGVFYGNSTGTQYLQNINDAWNVTGSFTAAGAIVSDSTISSTGSISTNGVFVAGATGQYGYTQYCRSTDGATYWLVGALQTGTNPLGGFYNHATASVAMSLNGTTNAATFISSVTATDFIISSDARLKDNVRRLEHTGYTIEHLNGYSFDLKTTGKKSIGFIAQEVQQVLPELVHENEDGFLAVSYSQVVAVLVEEVKSLRARVFALEAR